jgi:hypothetical protein
MTLHKTSETQALFLMILQTCHNFDAACVNNIHKTWPRYALFAILSRSVITAQTFFLCQDKFYITECDEQATICQRFVVLIQAYNETKFQFLTTQTRRVYHFFVFVLV